MIRPVTGLTLSVLAALALQPACAATGGENAGKQLDRIHLLVRAGKNEEAASAMRSLYPKGPPRGAAAMEYYRIIGNTAKGWEEARHGLEKLAKAEPGKPEYQLALAQVLAMRPATQRDGMQIFVALSRRNDIDRKQVMQAWRDALSGLDNNSPASMVSYQEYLAVDPENAGVRDELVAAKRAEAKRLPWQLRDKADAQLSAGHPEQAEATLKYALQLDPKNAWVRFDLSRLYHKRGDKKQGRALMQEGLTAAPGDADMLYANALYVGLLDEAENALHLLDRIPVSDRTPAMLRLRKKMTIEAQTQQALAYARDGRRPEMQAAMSRAESDAGDEPELVSIVANAWIDLHEPDRGVKLMRRLAQRPAAPIGTRLYYADLLNRAERNDELASMLRSLSAARGLSDSDREELLYLNTSLAARRADDARHAGKLAAARAALAPALKQYPDNTDLLMALARIHTSAHEPQKANDTYRKILQHAPDYAGARVALARSLNDMGDKAAAQKEMETVLASAPRDAVDTRMDVADWYVGTGNLDAARAIVNPLLEISPDNPRVLAMEGRIAKADGDYGEAMGYFRKAGATGEIADLESRRAGGSVATGVDFLSKTDGAPGISNLKAVEVPVEIRVPAGYSGGQALFHIDSVSADPGTLQLSDLYNLRQFGTVLAAPGATTTNAPSESAHGIALAAGYEGNGLRADIGTTPLGFPVSNVVGGVKWSHYTATTGFSFDLSRRPMTSSLLAYAGARDPVTGEVWGGVVSNGASLHLSRDRGRLSGFIDLGYYAYTGKNVLSNTEYSLRTGFNWSLVDEQDMRLTAGLAFTDWHYRENLRFYTFGHGGYYSPQKYQSLSIPFRWTGREARWSYLLQGSGSISVSYEKTMPYYPTDAALQAQGVANSAFQTPVYTGGNGHGTGYSLLGALEYQFTPKLFGGGRFEIDRSAYYAPNFAILYLRYLFDGHTGPVPYPPDPVKPYSRF
jgi:cellulose synthase operon protein C